MKKHNEGYVLAYVMVIIAVLMLVSASVMGVALKNLQRQKAEVETMQAKYAAEGAIERAIVELKAIKTQSPIHFIELDGVEIGVVDGTVNGNTCNLRLIAAGKPADETLGNKVVVTCELKLQNGSTIETTLDGNRVYVLDNVQNVEYVSYTISTVEEMGGGGDA